MKRIPSSESSPFMTWGSTCYPSSHNHGSVENGCISNMIVSFHLEWFSTKNHGYWRFRVTLPGKFLPTIPYGSVQERLDCHDGSIALRHGQHRWPLRLESAGRAGGDFCTTQHGTVLELWHGGDAWLGGGFNYFLSSTPTWGNDQIWQIFLKGVETTNSLFFFLRGWWLRYFLLNVWLVRKEMAID